MSALQPQLEILLATYNGEKYLREQIDSIRSQTFTDWILLVSDDCSTDKTFEILESYAERDERIKILPVCGKFGSAQTNFMRLARESSAKYIMFCDQDDVWLPNKVERTLAAMDALEKDGTPGAPCIVFSDAEVVDSDLNTQATSFIAYINQDGHATTFPQLLTQNVMAGCTMMANRKAIDTLCRANAGDGMIMHDWWLALIGAAFGRVAFIDAPLLKYRQHETNTLGATEAKTLKKPDTENLHKQIDATISQAAAFLRAYSGELSAQDKLTLERYIASGKGGLSGVSSLIASGCWRHGAKRRAGQIYHAFVCRGASSE